MDTVIVIGSDEMGAGDSGLGRKILGSFLKTLPTVDPRPETVVLYNGAVRLMGPASPHLEALRALEEAGVEILGCITCLEFYGLTADIAVGRISNMREIVQHLQRAAKVVTI